MENSDSPIVLKPQIATLFSGAQVYIFDHSHNNWVKLSNAQPMTVGCNGQPSDRLFSGSSSKHEATIFTITSNDPMYSPITFGSQVSFSSSNGNLGNNNCGSPTQGFFSTSSGNTDVINWILKSINSGSKVVQCFSAQDFGLVKKGGYRANNLFFKPADGSGRFVGYTDANVKYQNVRYFALWKEKSNASHFELFLVSPTCSMNSNCTDAGLATDMCYQGVCVPQSNLSDSQILNSVCRNPDDVASTQCVGWANSLSDTSPTRSSYGSALSVYCHQQYETTGKVPLQGPCVCITAANDLQVQRPECFFPGCSSHGPDIFLTGEQKQFLNSGGCSGECDIVINCVGDNVKCEYDQNTFCNYCKNQQGAGTICGGSTPSDWKKYWEKLKMDAEKYKYYLIAVGAILFILIVVAVVLGKRSKNAK